MIIAIFSDIHGNDIAFEAAIKHAKSQGAEKFLIAGDLITDYPLTSRVLKRAKELTPYIVRGNRDELILDYHKKEHQDWGDYYQTSLLQYIYDRITPEDLAFLQTLPPSLLLPLDDKNTLHMTHRIPQKNYHWAKAKEHMEIVRSYYRTEAQYRDAPWRVFVIGHTHSPGILQDENRLLINPGSIGGSYVGRFAAEYALLEWRDGKGEVQILTADYDRDKAVEALVSHGLLDNPRTTHWTQLLIKTQDDGRNYFAELLLEADRLYNERKSKAPYFPDDVWLDAIKFMVEKGILPK